LEQLSIKRPLGKTVKTEEQALAAANELGYPVLILPSYVLGGQNMIIAFSDDDVREIHGHYPEKRHRHPI
jgi:carbamoyl-phosphate synthase large subunit